MIETVQERQRGAYNFENYYENLCALQDTCPIPAVKGHLSEGIFDINGDRIRQQDWPPIFNSIKINKSLKFISIRSYFQLNLENGMPEKKAKILRSRIPIIRSKEMTSTLCKALRDCLITTESLECLELQGIHLRESDITLIGQGIMKNSTLKHLSLESSKIGDSGLLILCSAMKIAGNISSLNLTSCNLSPNGVRGLGDLIKFQAMKRHNEAWKESLRYRWANFDSMCGIRRMTLNCNFGIGDEGALILSESLRDDLWVKAIDLQECGLTNNAVRSFTKVLKYNSTLVVLDLRRNPMIDRDLLKSVTEQVLVNGNGKETEFKWLRVKDLMRNTEENYDRHPRSYYSGPTKPLDFSSRPAFKPAGRLRSRSANCIDQNSSNDVGNEDSHVRVRVDSSRLQLERNINNAPKGLPWRTAARATRYKGYPPDHIPGKSNIEEHCEDFKFSNPENYNNKKQNQPILNQSSLEYKSRKNLSAVESHDSVSTDDDHVHSVVSPLVNGTSRHPPIPEKVKELKTEIFHLRMQLDKYQKDKSAIELKLDEIYNENKRLRNTIKLMSKTNAVIAERTEQSSILQNEAILETIENSFNQFNAFLDMLRQSGLGKIVTAAGMDDFARSKDYISDLNKLGGGKTNNASKIHFGIQRNAEEFLSESNSKESINKKENRTDDNVNNNNGSNKSCFDENRQSPNSSSGGGAGGGGFSCGTIERKDNSSMEQKLKNNENTDKNKNKGSLEFVGWKDNFAINTDTKLKLESFPDQCSVGNDGLLYDDIEDPVDKITDIGKKISSRTTELDEKNLWDYQDDSHQSSTSSIASNSKPTKATTGGANQLYFEDCTVVTESMGNGMDNDVNANNLFAHQLSLDTAQDISFDNSIHDLY